MFRRSICSLVYPIIRPRIFLQHQFLPLNFEMSFRYYTTERPLVEQINMYMAKILEKRSLEGKNETIRLILRLSEYLRKKGEPLNQETYEHILSAYSRKDDSSKIWMLQKRMDAEGLQPTRSFYQKALKFAGRTGNVSLQARILHMMGIYGYTITNRTYYYLILGACRNWELERALDLLVEMDKKQIRPNLDSYLEIIDLAIKFRQASVAFELLQKVEKLESFKGPHQDTYLKVLNCAAVEGHYNIAKTIWEEAVKRYNLKADEGTCLYIMNLAGQNNDPYLTNDVLRNISDQGHRFRECHFIPLIEAYASTKDISGISTIFKSMRGVGVIPNKSMATMLIRKFGRDRTAARKARNNLMKAAKRSEYIDVVVFNFVIHALAYFAANEEAISMYNRREEYGVTQNSETVDAVLDACIHSHDAELGETIYQRALSEGIKPSSTTLSKMVALMTILDKYEEAFKYLELMKSQNMIPLRGCYYTLIKRLSYNNDERAHTVVDDMRACGYELSEQLRDIVQKMTERRLMNDTDFVNKFKADLA